MIDIREAMRQRHPPLPEPMISRENTGLLIIDMQYYDAHPDYGICDDLKSQSGLATIQYYTDRLNLIIPNIQQLLAAFRKRDMEIIYARIQSLTRDGRDRSQQHKDLSIHCPPNSKEAQILEQIAPRNDEIVLSKTCGSVFNGTMIDYVLRNISIQNLVVAGVVTNGCVEVSVRDASDRSYRVIVAEDACATWTEEMQQAGISAMQEVHAKIKSTSDILRILEQ